MIVTVQAPSHREAVRAQFECMKFGLECEYMEGDILNITASDISKVQNICATIDGDILAIVNRSFAQMS